MRDAIGDVVEHAVGGGWGSDEPGATTEEVLVVRGADFPSLEVQSLDGVPVRHEEASKLPQRVLQEGDIVLEISGGTKDRPTGRTVFITAAVLDQARCPVIPASFCRLVRIDPTQASPRFVYYALQALYAQGGTWEFQNQSTGLSNFQFRLFLSNYRLPRVEITEQRAIAEVLGALDDKIAANTTLVQAADALAAALTRRVLSTERVPLDQIATLTMGSSPPGTSYNEIGEGTVFYQGVRDFGVRFPQNRVWTVAPLRLAQEGDTLVSVRAPVGRTNLAAEETCIGRGLAAAQSRSGHAMSLFHLLRDDPTVWEPFEAEGTVFGSINKHQLEGLLVPAVAPDSADALEGDLVAIEGRIAAALTENVSLAKTRDELLPLLMSGKVRVKDAEKVVEGVV